MWELKMCRLVWQLLGMLGSVLGMFCNVLGMLYNVLGVPHRRKPPHLLPYKLWSQESSVPPSFVHYSLGFTAYKAASGEGGFLRCGTPRTLQKSMLRMPRTLQACLGRWKVCLGHCKAGRRRPRTLPSMPRSCQTSLHILSSHIYIFIIIIRYITQE